MMTTLRWVRLRIAALGITGMAAVVMLGCNSLFRTDDLIYDSAGGRAANTTTGAGGGSANGGSANGGSSSGSSSRGMGSAGGMSSGGGAGSGGNGVKRVFVTSAAWDGDLNGLAGADEKCEEAAIAAELGGNWVAWLSVSNQPAADRLKDVGPWYRVNGTELVVEDKEDLLEMGPSVPIEYSELGTLPLEPGVWTGTRDSGAGSEMNCQDWNTSVASEGLYGNWQQVTHWSGFVFFAPCSTKMSLYCFEQ